MVHNQGVTSSAGSPATHEGALLDRFWNARRAEDYDQWCRRG